MLTTCLCGRQPELKRIFNSRQLAYKISCNSIFDCMLITCLYLV